MRYLILIFLVSCSAAAPAPSETATKFTWVKVYEDRAVVTCRRFENGKEERDILTLPASSFPEKKKGVSALDGVSTLLGGLLGALLRK